MYVLQHLHGIARRAAVAPAVDDVPELARRAIGAEEAGALLVLDGGPEVLRRHLLARLAGVHSEDGPAVARRAAPAGPALDQVEELARGAQAALLALALPRLEAAGRFVEAAAGHAPAPSHGRRRACRERDDPYLCTGSDSHRHLPAPWPVPRFVSLAKVAAYKLRMRRSRGKLAAALP